VRSWISKSWKLFGSWNTWGAGTAGAGILSGPGPPLLLYHKLEIMSRKFLFNFYFKKLFYFIFYFKIYFKIIFFIFIK